jgi:hypothetical protein
MEMINQGDILQGKRRMVIQGGSRTLRTLPTPMNHLNGLMELNDILDEALKIMLETAMNEDEKHVCFKNDKATQ